MKKHYRHENDCLNCGTELNGKYCHSCGQENLQVKESFGHMITHAVSDYFHFDHQFFHTLKPLFFSPGKLTNEYMAGRRVQYLHPVKMYIFISLVYFLVLFSSKGGEVSKLKKDESRKEAVKTIQENPSLTKKEKEIALKDVDLFITQNNKNETVDTTDNIFLSEASDSSYQQYLAKQQKLPESKKDGFLERYFYKKAYAWNKNGGENSKEMIGEAVKHNSPKLMFFLLPMFALILKLTFYKNKKFYVEHLIFSFHLHCFLFLFLTVLMLLERLIPVNWGGLIVTLNIAAVVAVAYYIYKAFRVVYVRSRFRTVTKMIGVAFTYLLLFSISFGILIVISAILAL